MLKLKIGRDQYAKYPKTTKSVTVVGKVISKDHID